ncbi:hypothetical protein ACRAR1_07900 [Streptomyces sanyensis]|uniref:hypothetical protein n=1 Tax=Streptomyces sanyensis TaxID=568869 RepID=UPI003D7782F1
MSLRAQTLAAAGELQRDLQRELTYDGLRAAEAKGNKGGRSPAVTAGKTDAVRTAYLEGRSIAAALARDHGVSRTPVAALLPEHTTVAPAPELPVVLDMPGKVTDFLRATELEPAERAALDQGVTIRRGQGYSLRVSATPAVHRQLLIRCQPVDGPPAIPAQRKARREYARFWTPVSPGLTGRGNRAPVRGGGPPGGPQGPATREARTRGFRPSGPSPAGGTARPGGRPSPRPRRPPPGSRPPGCGW